MPERIQLRRTKGWRKPEGAIVVARPSRWGNPYIPGTEVQVSGIDADGHLFDTVTTMTVEMAVDLYRGDLVERLTRYPNDHPADADAAITEEWIAELEKLRGHDLGCWCPLTSPCHASVLLEFANG